VNSDRIRTCAVNNAKPYYCKIMFPLAHRVRDNRSGMTIDAAGSCVVKQNKKAQVPQKRYLDFCVRTIKKIFSAVLRMTSNSHKIS